MAVSSPKINRLINLSIVLEYYDLMIYGLLAKYISKIFYSNDGLFWTFLVFLLGQGLRYFGGSLLGILGDLFGKEKIFLFSLWGMAIATLIMGILPGNNRWGTYSTIFFSVSRLVQSLSFGAGMPGSLTILAERIDPKKLGRSYGNMLSLSSLGIACGIYFISWETRYLTTTQMMSWGFRIPFILGGSLALIGTYLRKSLLPKEIYVPNTTIQWKKLLNWGKYKNVFACLIAISLFPLSISVLKGVFPVYLNHFYGWPMSKIYFFSSLGYLISASLKFLGGICADYFSKIKMIRGVGLFGILGTMLSFWALSYSGGLIVFTLFSNIVTSIATASYFRLFAESFPSNIRYTWVSLIYNSNSLLASSIPLIMHYAYGKLQQPIYLIFILTFLSLCMVLGSIVYPPLAKKVAS